MTRAGSTKFKPMVFSGLILLILAGMLETAAFVAVGSKDYRLRLRNTLLYFGSSNRPIGPMPAVPWPSNTLMVRVPDGPKTKSTYRLGERVIPNAFLASKTALLRPEDLRGDSAIVIIGGSAAFGFPYHYSETFAGRLEKLLQGRYRVVNVAQVGWSSGQLIPIVQRVVTAYPVKALVVFSGNNEWVQWSHVERRGKRKLTLQFYQLCSYSHLLSSIVYRQLIRAPRNTLDIVQDRIGDYQPHQELTGIDFALKHPIHRYRPFDPQEWQELKSDYLQRFEQNLRQIVQACAELKIPTLLLTMPYKHRLSPAWKHPQPLYPTAKQEPVLDLLIQRIQRRLAQDQWDQALAAADTALALSPSSSLLHYLKAEALAGKQSWSAATSAYALARENMIGNLGSVRSVNKVIRRVAQSSEAALIDICDRFATSSAAYFTEDLIDDDCHPNAEGHKIIAEHILHQMRATGIAEK